MFRGFFAAEQVASLLGANESQVNDVAQKYFSTSTDEVSPAAFNRLEFRRYLHDQLLRDTDIFSMAHSIEARVPLLDHRVVEYVSRMNPASKLCTALNKPLLVNSVDHPLVRQAASRSKRGFSFPMDRWMKARVELLEEMSNASSVLNRGTASAAWELFRNGRLHWSRAWALAVLGGRN
jgi:asparagine synthase (glutamine-hydrolysing)